MLQLHIPSSSRDVTSLEMICSHLQHDDDCCKHSVDSDAVETFQIPGTAHPGLNKISLLLKTTVSGFDTTCNDHGKNHPLPQNNAVALTTISSSATITLSSRTIRPNDCYVHLTCRVAKPKDYPANLYHDVRVHVSMTRTRPSTHAVSRVTLAHPSLRMR